MSGTAESVHAKLHDVADKVREASPSSLGKAASQAGGSLDRARGVAAARPRRNGLVLALLVVTLLALWRWSHS